MSSSKATPRIHGGEGIRTIPPGEFYATKPKTPAKPSVASRAQQVQSSDPTPPKGSSHGVEKRAGAKVKDVRERLKIELGEFSRVGELHPTLIAIIHSFETTVITGRVNMDITRFLQHTSLYDGKRWKHVPKKAKSEARLYRIFKQIFQAIESFELFRGAYIYGQYQDVHSLQINHKLDTTARHAPLHTKPDSVILERDHCMKNCGFNSVRYCHVRTAFDIKTQASAKKSDNSMQVASYARQILAEQPGRAWVPSLIVTETQFRFFGFDRSGAWYSSWQDLHQNAELFVLAALVMFGCDPMIGHVLPLERRGSSLLRKHANITFIDAQADPERETEAKGVCWTRVKPLVYRHTIRGRATMCAAVEDLDMPESLPEKARTEIEGTRLLVKMYWKAEKRSAEWDFLLRARGAAGVGQLIGYGEGDHKISAFRGTHVERLADTIDRTACHLLLERYDGPLCCAPNPGTLLEALRDAIKGHQYLLFKCGILHRDISVNNIVYDARKRSDSRGRVIDLDLAVDVKSLWTSEHRRTEGDARTGTKAYLSYKLLVGNTQLLGPHDHMDDLESFFYVLFHLVLTLDGTTKHVPNLPEVMKKWEDEDLTTGADLKFSLLDSPLRHVIDMGSWFQPHQDAVIAMFRTLKTLFFARIYAVRRATDIPADRLDYQARNWSVKERLDAAEGHYTTFIDALDECLNDIKGKERSTASPSDSEDDASPPDRTNRHELPPTHRDFGLELGFIVQDEPEAPSDNFNEDEDDEEAEPFGPWDDFEDGPERDKSGEDVFNPPLPVNVSQSSSSLHPDMARMSFGARGEKRASDEGDNAEDDTRRRKKAK